MKEKLEKVLYDLMYYGFTIACIGVGGVNIVHGVSLAYDRYRLSVEEAKEVPVNENAT